MSLRLFHARDIFFLIVNRSVELSSSIDSRFLIEVSNGGGGTGMRTRESLLFQYVINYPAFSSLGDHWYTP